MIDTIRMQNFRSYTDSSFDFEGGVNVIVGPNASGKTNLLEAILMICRGKSYRVADKDLLKHNHEWLRLDSTGETNRTIKLKHTDNHFEKEYVIDETTFKRLPYNQTLPVVLFEPNHLLLLTQSPDLRRSYIDDVLEQIEPEFGVARRNYKRALAQRNKLLKQQANTADFFVWDIRLSELGGHIAQARRRFIHNYSDELTELYVELVGASHVAELAYKSSVTDSSAQGYGDAMLRRLQATHAEDKVKGFTGTGPHRDDLVMSIDGHHLSLTGSRGETRTMVLALKLLELKALEAVRDQKPILLLDDVFSELDGSRRRNLTNYLTSYQTFITTTDADIVVQHFLDNCHVIAMD